MAHLESELARFEAEIKAATAGAALPPPPIARSPQAVSLPPPPVRASNGYASHASAGPSQVSLPQPPSLAAPPQHAAPPQYGQQPSYPSQQAAPPQMPPHQVPYASQPMYPQTAATYPAYPQAAPVPSYYVAPAHAYPQPQMHDTSIQQPQTAAQVAMMAAIKADVESQGKTGKPKLDKSKAVFRSAAGQKWWDPTLTEWAENDFRIFVGDMGNEVNDDILTKAFTKYASFQKAKIVRDKHSNKSKGYGFVSFSDAVEGAKALREMNGKYIGNRPCKLRKSSWQERTPENAHKGKRKATEGAGNQPKKPGIFHK